MKSSLHADGHRQLGATEDIRSQLRGLEQSIRERHAAELAEAGFIRRFLVHRKIAAEFRRERTGIEPSPGSLFIG